MQDVFDGELHLRYCVIEPGELMHVYLVYERNVRETRAQEERAKKTYQDNSPTIEMEATFFIAPRGEMVGMEEQETEVTPK